MSSPPDSSTLRQRRQKAVPRGPFHVMSIDLERARGARLIARDGTEFIDFAGGIGTMNVGHGNPRVLEAIRRQSEKLVHTSIHLTPYEPYVRLAERLNERVPISGDVKSVFFNSGAEGVENAVKLARAHTGRSALITFDGGFHGRTMAALSMTGEVDPYRSDYGTMFPFVHQIPHPYPYRNPFDETDPEALSKRVVEYIEERVFHCRVAPTDVAAVLVEPVLGEGGFVVPPPDFLRRLKNLCEEHGMLLIADEVQTGFGRTGRMFACEHFDVQPHLMVLAKSLAAGMPLSVVCGEAEIMDTPRVGALGGTYGGNPVACAAGLAVLEEFEEKNLLERARGIGHAVEERFQILEERFELVGEHRGIGPMRALELVSDPHEKTPATEKTVAVLERCHENGLAVMRCGIYGNVIRTLMPLVIEDEELETGLDVLERALEAES